jgi:hypothetical protein
MTERGFRGVMKGQTLVVLDQAVPLPDGTPVEVSPLHIESGSSDAVLAAVSAEPHVTGEDVAELTTAIRAGRRPATKIDPFAEDACNSEST